MLGNLSIMIHGWCTTKGCALAEEGGFRMSITVKYCIIGVSLGEPHTSVTYCTHASVCSDHLPSAFKFED